MRRFRMWLIKILACGKPVAMNLRLIRGLYIDGEKSMNGFYQNIRIDYNKEKGLPEDIGIYISINHDNQMN